MGMSFGEIISFIRYHLRLYSGEILYWSICIILLILISFYSIGKRTNRTKALKLTCFITYVFLVLIVTLFARKPCATYQAKLQLFWSVRSVLDGRIKMLQDIILNILLFVPYGFGLLSISVKKKFMQIQISGFISSSIIEVLQLVTKRGFFEFDDIIFNTLGVLCGAMVYALYSCVKRNHK